MNPTFQQTSPLSCNIERQTSVPPAIRGCTRLQSRHPQLRLKTHGGRILAQHSAPYHRGSGQMAQSPSPSAEEKGRGAEPADSGCPPHRNGAARKPGFPAPSASARRAAPHTKWRPTITASEGRCGGEAPLSSGPPHLAADEGALSSRPRRPPSPQSGLGALGPRLTAPSGSIGPSPLSTARSGHVSRPRLRLGPADDLQRERREGSLAAALRKARGPGASAPRGGTPATARGARVEPLRPRPGARPGPAHRPSGRSRRCRAPPPSFPHAKCPLVTPVPPRPALPRRSPQLLPAPPGPAPVPVAQRLSSGCGSPRGSGFRAHAHLAPTRGWRRARCAEPGAGLPPPLSLRRGARSGRAPHLFAGPTEESKEAPQNRQPTV